MRVVESAALAAVDLPPSSQAYEFHPNTATSMVHVSEVQRVAARAACARLDEELLSGSAPNVRERAGFLLGDGMGLGKTRTIALVLHENCLRGRKRHLWLVPSAVLADNLVSADENRSDLRRVVPGLPLHRSVPGLDEEGVVVCTYASLVHTGRRSGDGARKRAEKEDTLVRWLCGGKNHERYDGVIVLDESHVAKNLGSDTKGGRGSSLTANLVQSLQTKLPQARVVYSSATFATDVPHLTYLSRLGVDAPNAGASLLEKELFLLELKEKGALVARQLSLDRIEFGVERVSLEQRHARMYRLCTEMWRDLRRAGLGAAAASASASASATAVAVAMATSRAETFDAAEVVASDHDEGEGEGKGKDADDPYYWGAHQRFFRQLLTSLKVERVCELAEEALEQNKSVVVGLQSTFGSVLERIERGEREGYAAKRARHDAEADQDEDDESDGLESSCEDTLRWAIKELAAHTDFESQIGALRLPSAALDALIRGLGGADRVAELTSRTARQEHAQDGPVVRKRSASTSAELEAFMTGRKHVAVVSDAASTGFSLHAAAFTDAEKAERLGRGESTERRRRLHITMELAWAADRATQQLGRTHRANQTSVPEFRTVVTDVGGEARFVAAVAQRIASMGALTQGDHTGSVGASAIPMDWAMATSKHGDAAYQRLLEAFGDPASAVGGALTPWRDRLFAALEADAALGKAIRRDVDARVNCDPEWCSASNVRDVLQDAIKVLREFGADGTSKKGKGGASRTFLNRVLGLPLGYQAVVMAAFASCLDDVVRDVEAQRGIDDRMVAVRGQVTMLENQVHDLRDGLRAESMRWDRRLAWDAADRLRESARGEVRFGTLAGDDQIPVMALEQPEGMWRVVAPTNGAAVHNDVSLDELSGIMHTLEPTEAARRWRAAYAEAEVSIADEWLVTGAPSALRRLVRKLESNSLGMRAQFLVVSELASHRNKIGVYVKDLTRLKEWLQE